MATPKQIDDQASMLDLNEHPGHLLRRAQQISTALFYEEVGSDLTPVQYAMLNALAAHPGIDQVSLSGLVAIDTSTGATVCARLEEKGLIERKVLPHNRRQRALTVTPAGQDLLDALSPGAQRLRQRLLAPLDADEQRQFMTLLGKLVRENNDQSRVPQTGAGLSPTC
jgi:DNA-binding MarR family transcriptional regulator